MPEKGLSTEATQAACVRVDVSSGGQSSSSVRDILSTVVTIWSCMGRPGCQTDSKGRYYLLVKHHPGVLIFKFNGV